MVGRTVTNISGATGSSYTTTSAFAVADNGLAYRALVTNSLGTTTSDTACLNNASLVVNSTSDADVVRGAVSLRQALAYAGTFASGTATVSLDASLTASPLTLNLGTDLMISSTAGASVVLAGPGADRLTLQGGGASSNYGGVGLLQGTATVSGVTISGFHTNGLGGGVVNVLGGTLNLVNVAVVGNSATDPSDDTFGGGVFNAGTLM